jgi:hypothetical protein
MVAPAFRQASGLTSDNRCYRRSLRQPVEPALSARQQKSIDANATTGHIVRGMHRPSLRGHSCPGEDMPDICQGADTPDGRCVDRALCPPLEGAPRARGIDALPPRGTDALLWSGIDGQPLFSPISRSNVLNRCALVLIAQFLVAPLVARIVGGLWGSSCVTVSLVTLLRVMVTGGGNAASGRGRNAVTASCRARTASYAAAAI